MSTVACGILVIERGYALCGLTPKSEKYSGIGGKQEPGETIEKTAFREAVEELFGVDPSESLIDALIERFSNNPIVERNNYFYILMDFIDAFDMNNLVYRMISISPYYKTFPSSILDLVLNRCPTEDAEITELTLTKYSCPTLSIDHEFIKDCTKAESLLKLYGSNERNETKETTPHMGRFSVE